MCSAAVAQWTEQLPTKELVGGSTPSLSRLQNNAKMTICNKCLIDKPLTEFAFADKAAGKYQRRCNSCRKIGAKASYQRHKAKVVAKNVVRGQGYRQEFRDYKSTLSCNVCGEDETCCLDFHHLDPTQKDFVVSEMINKVGRKKIEEELAKCVCLCANCHRKVHAGIISLT